MTRTVIFKALLKILCFICLHADTTFMHNLHHLEWSRWCDESGKITLSRGRRCARLANPPNAGVGNVLALEVGVGDVFRYLTYL